MGVPVVDSRPHDSARSPLRYPGNVAKFRLVGDLERILRERSRSRRETETLRILDVGCVGPSAPLDLWIPLLDDAELRFHLTGIDVAGIDRAEAVRRERGWVERVELHEGTAYGLDGQFGEGVFDLVVSTQVLEHLARYPTFIHGLGVVLAPGGEALMSCDSAHFGGKYPQREPWLLAKRIVKRMLAWMGNEGHYDIPLYDRDLDRQFARTGLSVVNRRYYNLGPVKALHNHLIDDAHKDGFLETWAALEEMVNDATGFGEEHKALFRCLYYRVRKERSAGEAGR